MDNSTFDTVRVWDPLLRLFHWSLALCVTAAWLLGKYGPDEMTLHFYFGYTVLGLLAFRLLWGFFGPENARFVDFLHGPATVLEYTREVLRRRPSYRRGHNPMGGLFALALMSVLAVHALAGLFADPEDYLNVGPLADLVGTDMARTALSWHNTLSWVLLWLVVLHVSAVAFYAVWKHENLVRPMITGRKRVPKGVSPQG